jgi:hypothetical protein
MSFAKEKVDFQGAKHAGGDPSLKSPSSKIGFEILIK